MLHWLRRGWWFLLPCLVGSGCLPTPETSLDEQKNPHYQAGKERLSALDYKGALVSFERALDDNPKSALAHYELGVLYDQHENDYAAALYHYNRALKLRPSAYPADNIRQRIPACRQELIKEDSLAVINPSVLRETERLREENQALRRQVEILQAYVASRPPVAVPVGLNTSAAGPRTAAGYSGPAAWTGTNSGGGRFASSTAERTRAGGSASSSARTHSVRAGETATAIARQYHVKVSSLLAANPGLEPRRLRVGQVLNVPAP